LTAREATASRFAGGFAALAAARAAGFAAPRVGARRPEDVFAAGRLFAFPVADLAGLRFAPALFLCLVSLAMQSLLGGASEHNGAAGETGPSAMDSRVRSDRTN
jgi:hypothetical protein